MMLCKEAHKVFARDAIALPVQAPINVVADLRGQLSSSAADLPHPPHISSSTNIPTSSTPARLASSSTNIPYSMFSVDFWINAANNTRKMISSLTSLKSFDHSDYQGSNFLRPWRFILAQNRGRETTAGHSK
jgi:hypothetical protein